MAALGQGTPGSRCGCSSRSQKACAQPVGNHILNEESASFRTVIFSLLLEKKCGSVKRDVTRPALRAPAGFLRHRSHTSTRAPSKARAEWARNGHEGSGLSERNGEMALGYEGARRGCFKIPPVKKEAAALQAPDCSNWRVCSDPPLAGPRRRHQTSGFARRHRGDRGKIGRAHV